ncbi:nucleotidyltransferase domain-containing protein [uncultured Desulfosarcina sp.]|uniref:type VII toxin-antitoxin system MntA family adenylyltransferase antitoxin n=1 Tax=uncultured Desulfosarcina sp. TaxID=218289 RepID=UPI0029C66841|nr:nucleotidyltransferase domain-containing protein [uncultured Desulfosarcina sp.]
MTPTNPTTTIGNYFKDRKEVVAAYLFGSHAAGKERPFSDVDVGVVLTHQDQAEAFQLQSQYTVAMGRKLRKDIHVVVMNTAGETLLKQIFQKGVCVCVNNPSVLARFKMIRFSMIGEFGYYLDMTQAGFRRKLIGGKSHGR